MAFVMGLSALWIAGGSCIGMLVAWFWVGPRLLEHTLRKDQLIITIYTLLGGFWAVCCCQS